MKTKILNFLSSLFSVLSFGFFIIFLFLRSMEDPEGYEILFFLLGVFATPFSFMENWTTGEISYYRIVSAILFIIFFTGIFFLPKILFLMPKEFFYMILLAGVSRIIHVILCMFEKIIQAYNRKVVKPGW